MSNDRQNSQVDRRGFFKTAGAGLTAGLVLAPGSALGAAAAMEQARPMTDKEKLLRIASCSYPLRLLFRQRSEFAPAGAAGAGAGRGGGRRGGAAGQPPAAGAAGTPPAGSTPTAAGAGQAGAPAAGARGGRGGGGGTASRDELRKKYGTITMMDFPQFTKDTFPGVTHMDIWSSLCGDPADSTMFGTGGGGGGGFDPSLASSRKWIDQLASKLVTTGTKIQHISNNAPGNMSSMNEEARQAGLATARKWLDMAKTLGVVSMRVNTGGPEEMPVARRLSGAEGGDGYPRNRDIIQYFDKCVESFKEMAEYGGKVGVKVTIENHWGLAADPMRIVAILEAVNHPYCEATPDFCNWENEYMLFSGLKVLAPYSKSNVHAKYWERWGDKQDPARATRIMIAGGFKGTFALEYEAGPWDGVEGSRYLMKEVLAGLSTPVAEVMPEPAARA